MSLKIIVNLEFIDQKIKEGEDNRQLLFDWYKGPSLIQVLFHFCLILRLLLNLWALGWIYGGLKAS